MRRGSDTAVHRDRSSSEARGDNDESSRFETIADKVGPLLQFAKDSHSEGRAVSHVSDESEQHQLSTFQVYARENKEDV